MIDPSSHLAAMIRAQFGAQFRAQAQTRHDAKREAPRNIADPGEPAEKGEAQLQQMVALRVRALAPEDPQRQRKAFRLFLESVLVQAFGRERLDDRGFDQLVDAVMQQMESDSDLHAALREAGDQLLAEATADANGRSTPEAKGRLPR
ncbi:hypothetical protein [Variovorax sp. OV700]|uniref:hypothetical protein n=1 Tax=Variovorax sp. OV700 TaxID=1882826 RepID=UPI0008846D03|nr:hypothetical protein [Variovorax sp. OV700]SDJ59296.1 hypothetical protein SAMN05444748_11656 [Variovorax sp. OV700]